MEITFLGYAFNEFGYHELPAKRKNTVLKTIVIDVKSFVYHDTFLTETLKREFRKTFDYVFLS